VLLSLNTVRLEPPLDLTPFNAPGCNMHVKNLITIAGTANAAGRYSLSGKLPASAPACRPIFMQFFCFDRNANGLGLTASNYGRALRGN
jgi:hypothetical protein